MGISLEAMKQLNVYGTCFIHIVSHSLSVYNVLTNVYNEQVVFYIVPSVSQKFFYSRKILVSTRDFLASGQRIKTTNDRGLKNLCITGKILRKISVRFLTVREIP